MAKKVLIVEDSPTQAAKMRLDFEQRNFVTDAAISGQEGLVKALLFSPDVIVLDLQLPDFTGFEVCKRLKKDLKLRNIPVIMFSADNSPRNMVTAYESGADYYVLRVKKATLCFKPSSILF
jgi:DNA-binding response OmpR family regulator